MAAMTKAAMGSGQEQPREALRRMLSALAVVRKLGRVLENSRDVALTA